MSRYEAPFFLRPRTLLCLKRCEELIDEKLAGMPANYCRQYGAAHLMGCAETCALYGDAREANELVALSYAVAQHGWDTVWEAHKERLATKQ